MALCLTTIIATKTKLIPVYVSNNGETLVVYYELHSLGNLVFN